MSTIDLGILILRVPIGLLFVGHGAQKLYGWFGRPGSEGTTKRLESLDPSPAEFLGGLGLALGFFTPMAAALIIGAILVDILKARWGKGLSVTKNDYEYTLVKLAIAAALGFMGPGKYSVDSLLGVNYPLPISFVLTLAFVITGVLLALMFSLPRRDEVKFPSA